MTGPPCAGKTTYVRQYAQPGEVVLDLDDIARRLGSAAQWHHEETITADANQAMWQAMTRVARSTRGRAWVIRSAPYPNERRRLAEWLRADETLVLLPPTSTLLARARARPRRARTVRAVRWWLATYRQDSHDVVVR